METGPQISASVLHAQVDELYSQAFLAGVVFARQHQGRVVTKRDIFLAMLAMHDTLPRAACNPVLEGFQSRIERWAKANNYITQHSTATRRVYYRITPLGKAYLKAKGFNIHTALMR